MTKSLMTLPKQDALDILMEDADGYEIVKDWIVDTSRWSIIHGFIVKDSGGRFWETSYSVGATESQDESPWEYDDEVAFTEVKPVEKTVTVYETIEL